ncbi:MAG: diguanylate cyclase [Thermacetogeniaceae bacterium]
MHPLLRQQLESCFGKGVAVPHRWRKLIDMVNKTYFEFGVGSGERWESLRLDRRKLLKENAEMQALIKAFPDVFFWVDRNGTILDYKAGRATDLYLESEDFVGKRIQDIPLKCVKEKFDEALRRVRESGGISRIEYSLLIRGKEHHYEARLLPLSKDRIFVIIRNITELKQKEKALQESENRLMMILDSVQSGILLINAETRRIAYVNRAGAELLGRTKERVIGSICHRFICPSEEGKCPLLDLGPPLERWEGVLLTPSGEEVAVIRSATALVLDERVYVLENFIDITERKRIEERLRYLSMHDPLTGLYNRAYFEEEMRRLSRGRRRPVGMIVCDIDGLKFINDTFGHDAGDAVLVAAADVLRSSFRKEDVVARVGGDEFAVLLPNTDRVAVEAAAQRIRDAIARYNSTNPRIHLSMSVGCSVSDDPHADINQLYKEADSDMYREKLHQSYSPRSSVVHVLLKTLEARDLSTESHSERLQKLVIALAQAFGLPQRKVTDLRLLAMFHDIGKIGVPDSILFKPGPLTPQEAAEMRRHCEIGYQIAKSARELAHIADWILKHHEWWNGEGYPLGLKGEEIPLECRILSVCDAYEAMVSDRPYRKAMTHREALAELIRCAGTQFDPCVVAKFLELMEERAALNLG